MRITVLQAHRLDIPRPDGSAGFRDVVTGETMEIPDERFDPALHAPEADPPTGRRNVISLHERSKIAEG